MLNTSTSTRFFKSLSRSTVLLLLLSPLLGWGQTTIVPVHTGTIASFPTWTHTNNTQGSIGGNDYLQLLTSTSALITPAINLAGYSAPQLNFKARTFGGPSTVQATISISISIDNGANYSAPVTRVPTSTALTSVATIDLSAYSGNQIKARIQTLGAASSNGVGIDDITVSGTVTAAATASAPGLLLLEDNFNYTAGTPLSANGWAIHDNTVGTNADVPTVAASNLTNASYPTGSLVTNANRVSVRGTSTSINKGFTVPSGSNTLYYSALINIPKGGTNIDYILHLLERTNATGTNAKNYRARLFARPGTAANTFKLGISATSNLGETPVPSYGTAEYAEGQTYLVVVKYLYAPGGNDAVSLFVFDNATAIPVIEPTTAIATLQQANNAAFSLPNGVAIRQTTSSSFVDLDGIRVATGWGAVVGNPVYTEATAVINAGNYYAVTMNDAAARLTPNGNINVENTLALANGLINTAAANILTLYSAAAVTGGSATSFVNGPLARLTPAGISTSTPFLFPVGKASFYRPFTVTLANQAAASTYTVEQLEGNPNPAGPSNLDTGNGLGTAPLKRVSRFRSFVLTSSVSTTANAGGTVTLSFDAGDRVNNPGDAGLVVAVSSGGAAFSNFDRSVSTGSGTGPGGAEIAGTLTSASFTTAAASATFVLGATNDNTTFGAAINPLPVELTTFSALRQASNGVAVKWATASEKNSARFEVERSVDGREFAVVASTTARGNSSNATVYAILDKTAPAATLYYRLRQVDLDGTAAHSPVVVVAGTGVASKSLLYPNPTRGSIYFLVEAATPYRVLNQLGQSLLHGTTESGTATIALNALAPGLYFLELQTANGRVMQKFEKATD